jgi:hypothetical protein
MMDYALEGQEIVRLCLDFSVVLQTVDGAELRIETEFLLASSSESGTRTIVPSRLGRSGSAVVDLLHRTVELVTTDEEGTLTLALSDGRRLECKPSGEFEAWSLVTAAGERWVCTPGGDIAHWAPGSSR